MPRSRRPLVATLTIALAGGCLFPDVPELPSGLTIAPLLREPKTDAERQARARLEAAIDAAGLTWRAVRYSERYPIQAAIERLGFSESSYSIAPDLSVAVGLDELPGIRVYRWDAAASALALESETVLPEELRLYCDHDEYAYGPPSERDIYTNWWNKRYLSVHFRNCDYLFDSATREWNPSPFLPPDSIYPDGGHDVFLTNGDWYTIRGPAFDVYAPEGVFPVQPTSDAARLLNGRWLLDGFELVEFRTGRRVPSPFAYVCGYFPYTLSGVDDDYVFVSEDCPDEYSAQTLALYSLGDNPALVVRVTIDGPDFSLKLYDLPTGLPITRFFTVPIEYGPFVGEDFLHVRQTQFIVVDTATGERFAVGEANDELIIRFDPK